MSAPANSRHEEIKKLREETSMSRQQFHAMRNDVFIAYMKAVKEGKQIVLVKNARIAKSMTGKLIIVDQIGEPDVIEWKLPKFSTPPTE